MSESMSMDQKQSGVELDLSNLHSADPKLFGEERILPYFAKMRAEQPVHYCSDSPYGPYWSVSRYADIKATDQDHVNFSSDAIFGGVQIDDAIVGDVNSDFFVKSFITMRNRTI